MGHRYIYSAPQIFDGEHEQIWNHMQTDQRYMHLGPLGRNSTSENAPVCYPMENISVDGLPFTSHWSPVSVPSSNGYGSSSVTVEVPPPQPEPSGSIHDSFLHSSTAGSFCPFPENYVLHGSSSNYERQNFQAVDGGYVDLTAGSGRGPHKRKSPGIPSVCEIGSTSRYFNAGSATDLPISSESQQEKQHIDSQYFPWDQININPPYRGNGLSIRGDGSLRNVRSRSAVDMESNLAMTHASSNHSHISFPSSHASDQSGVVDLGDQGSSSLSRDWSQTNLSHGHGGLLFPDTCGFGRDTNHFIVGSSASNAPLDMSAYHEFSTRNPSLRQSLHGNATQTVRRARNNHSQRSNPSLRDSSSLRMGHGDGLHVVSESYPARYSRLASSVWRNSERNGRSRVASERYRSFAEDAALRDRFSSEGFMIVDRASFYGPRNMFDQHRDMRMDIDNMTYEDLLALGERIGHVNTGLSEDLISKCMTETIHCSSEQSQEEGTCVICLEDYKNMDDIGALKTCGHDYHGSCIRKWLSMKNICPICKASVVDDSKEI